MCVCPCFENYHMKLNLQVLHSLRDVPTGIQMLQVFCCHMSNKKILRT
jgi:hypothetical protein